MLAIRTSCCHRAAVNALNTGLSSVLPRRLLNLTATVLDVDDKRTSNMGYKRRRFNANANAAAGQQSVSAGDGRPRATARVPMAQAIDEVMVERAERLSQGKHSRDGPTDGPPGKKQQGRLHASSKPTMQQAGPAAMEAAAAAPSGASGLPGATPRNKTALQHQSDVRFADLDISPLIKRAMAEVFGYEFATKVQAQSLPVCLSGQDVLAKAKTGTGKTVAFMIPALENLLRKPPRPGQVGVLVLSPTRELAMQIHAETLKLTQFQNMGVQVMIGGTNMSSEAKRLAGSTPQVLVATPGRCLDHLENGTLGPMMKDLRMLVLDEADNILDMGFRPTIEKILARLPDKSQRQTLLFSATFPNNVKQLANFAFRPSYQVVDTVGEESNTNVQVEQLSCVVPHHEVMMYLAAVLQKHMQQDKDFKVIVFFPTARMTQLYSETFLKLKMPVLEMHSRKSQAVRTRMSDQFRGGSRLIMMSSDVSARGVDYPDVSLVVQVGLPTDRDQYVHRVGRTARAGKAGQSLLLLASFEGSFLNKIVDLPVKAMGQLPADVVQAHASSISSALSQVPYDTKSKAYGAWLGFYKSSGMGFSVAKLVDTANEFSRIIGLPEPPELEPKLIGKMGLKGAPGLRVMGKEAVAAAAAARGPSRGRPQGPAAAAAAAAAKGATQDSRPGFSHPAPDGVKPGRAKRVFRNHEANRGH